MKLIILLNLLLLLNIITCQTNNDSSSSIENGFIYYFRNELDCSVSPGCDFGNQSNWNKVEKVGVGIFDDYVIEKKDGKGYVYMDSGLRVLGNLVVKGNVELLVNGTFLACANISVDNHALLHLTNFSSATFLTLSVTDDSLFRVFDSALAATGATIFDKSSSLQAKNAFISFEKVEFNSMLKLDANTTLSASVLVLNNGVDARDNTTIVASDLIVASEEDDNYIAELTVQSVRLMEETELTVAHLYCTNITIVQDEESSLIVNEVGLSQNLYINVIDADEDTKTSITSSTNNTVTIYALKSRGKVTLDIPMAEDVTFFSIKFSELVLVGNTSIKINGDLTLDDDAELKLQNTTIFNTTTRGKTVAPIYVSGTVTLDGELEIEIAQHVASAINYTEKYNIIESNKMINGEFEDLDVENMDSLELFSKLDNTLSATDNSTYVVALYFTQKPKPHMPVWEIILIITSVVSVVAGFAVVPYLYRKYRGYNTTRTSSEDKSPFFRLNSDKARLDNGNDIMLNVNENDDEESAML